MKKSVKYLLISLFVISPILFGLFALSFRPDSSMHGLAVILATVVGIPLILIIGLTTSVLTKNHAKSDLISLVSFAIPALLVCIYEFITILG